MEPRDIMDMIILAVIAVGLVWAAVRFFQDMTRPLPDEASDNSMIGENCICAKGGRPLLIHLSELKKSA